MAFEKNVFINCPFDKEYVRFLRPLLFTVIYCGLNPKISQTKDSGKVRIKHIYSLIQNSKYSVHDLSRMKAKRGGDLARFNMPFELGLDMGARFSARRNTKLARKKFLIIDAQDFRYQKALSDISGNDIEAYKNQPRLLVVKVRNWILSHEKRKIKTGSIIWEKYNEFYFDFTESLKNEGYKPLDFQEMKYSELIYFIKKWIRESRI